MTVVLRANDSLTDEELVIWNECGQVVVKDAYEYGNTAVPLSITVHCAFLQGPTFWSVVLRDLEALCVMGKSTEWAQVTVDPLNY